MKALTFGLIIAGALMIESPVGFFLIILALVLSK